MGTWTRNAGHNARACVKLDHMACTAKEPGLNLCGQRAWIIPVVYAADVIADEILGAVLRELPSDDPIRPALAALPKPVPFINSDPRHQSEIVASLPFDWLRTLVLHRAETDAAFVGQAEELVSLPDRLTVETAQAYERWAQASASLLRDGSERTLATHVALSALSLGRGDDRGVIEAVAKVLVHSRSWSGYLLVQDVAALLHDLGCADRRQQAT